MEGIRFYEEFTNTRKRVSEGTVVAILTETGPMRLDGCYDALSGTFDDWPNGPVSSGAVSREYLRKRCRRVAESKARMIHPALFERLDMEDA